MKKILILFACLLSYAFAYSQAKYVFYFIGDGMGTNQVLGTEMYLSEYKGRIGREGLIMTTFPYSGQVATFSHSNGITDSSAAGTCLASGVKTNNGTLGIASNGEKVSSIAHKLHAQKWGIGIMTSVALDHATPASFYAHSQSRESYYEIGQQLPYSQFSFFGGATFHQPNPKQNDPSNINLYHLLDEQGYVLARGYRQAQQILGVEKMVLAQETDGLDPNKPSYNIPYAIDRSRNDLTLAQMVEVAIPHLLRQHDRFFMMVEGGMIDYASHSNDAATVFQEVIAMDEALRVAYQFYLEHPDETLIVVTADHETGGMALGNSDYTLNLQLLQHQNCSAWTLSDKISALFKDKKAPKWDTVKSLLTEHLGFYDKIELSKEEDKLLQTTYKNACKHKGKDLKTLYKSINQIGAVAIKILNDKAKVGWTTHAHTAQAVPVFAIGVGAEQFSGWHDNTEIVPFILNATKNAEFRKKLPRRIKY